LVVYNTNQTADSNSNGVLDVTEIADYYALKRNIPASNLLQVGLVQTDWRTIYDSWVGPVKNKLNILGPENIYYIVMIGFPHTFLNRSITTLGMNIYNLYAAVPPEQG